MLSFLFLNDGDTKNEDHAAKQQCGFLRIAQNQVDNPAGDEEHEHRFADDVQDHHQEPALPGGREGIWTIRYKARCGIRL